VILCFLLRWQGIEERFPRGFFPWVLFEWPSFASSWRWSLSSQGYWEFLALSCLKEGDGLLTLQGFRNVGRRYSSENYFFRVVFHGWIVRHFFRNDTGSIFNSCSLWCGRLSLFGVEWEHRWRSLYSFGTDTKKALHCLAMARLFGEVGARLPAFTCQRPFILSPLFRLPAIMSLNQLW
jgi:hypothetical protein